MALLVIACATSARAGDLGRPEPNPLAEKLGTLFSGGPQTQLDITDEEREMRDRIWRFAHPPHSKAWLRFTVAVPGKTKAPDVGWYDRWLHGTTFASARVRYAAINEDATLDIETLPDTMVSICAVLSIDRQRGIAANSLPELEESMRVKAAARFNENQLLAGGLVSAAANRRDAYQYALDHMLVQAPSRDAVEVQATITDLDTLLAPAEHGDFCDYGHHQSEPPVIPSRYGTS